MTAFTVIPLTLLLIVGIASKSTPGSNVTVTQIHLAQGKTSESMTISWVTPSPSLISNLNAIQRGHLDQKPLVSKFASHSKGNADNLAHDMRTGPAKTEVRYSTKVNDLFMSAFGFSTSYTFNYKKYANYTSGLLHHTFLHGLKPLTTYYYQCGDFSTGSPNDVSGALRTFRSLKHRDS